jgi:hypothetical protein
MKMQLVLGAVALLAAPLFAQDASVETMKLRGEEVLQKSLLDGNGATCMVTEGNYGDMVTEGNYADMVTEGNYADMVTEGNYADMVTEGNYGSPLGLAARQMQEIDNAKNLPSPR